MMTQQNNNEKVTTEQWEHCKTMADKVIAALNSEINRVHECGDYKKLPPFNDTIMIITALLSSYSLLKLKSMSPNDKEQEIQALFTHYCASLFDLVNKEYWEFDYEH